ncbi:hypothetical protein BJX66DRAFT_349083 [Aspergillus keveii]|uniref:Uncharacterized protein n=1 Tax=Aspergillus keveii TaxID=714993 RepID=A0ABR4GDF5_9EURO
MVDLTVSNVSGLIAVGVAVLQVFISIALPIIILGFFRRIPATASASTWSVLARELHSSYWPTFLGADSSATSGVYVPVSIASWSRTVARVLTAIAAVVTPRTFHYIEDTSAFGSGTPLRDENNRFSRVCSGVGFETCPHSSGNVVSTTNESGIFVTGDWYDTRVSQDVVDCFQSGLLTMEPSVSSLFDIQARYTVMSPASDPDEFIPFDNNTAYPLSQLRPIQSLVTDGGYKLVEGLVVDLPAGGIGFRNHSAPPWRPHGSEWSEDLLFVEPETQCVDLNLTLDYDVVTSSSGSGGYENLVLTDRGGFANFQKDFSPTNWTTERSQKSAFRYLNSHIGKTFPLLREGAGTTSLGFLEFMSLQTSTEYGAYLQGTDNAFTGVNFSDTGSGNLTSFPAIHPNPFGTDFQNSTEAVPLCSRTTTWDYANITNIAVGCGLVYGVPQRLTAGDTLIFRDPGSKWSIPLYYAQRASEPYSRPPLSGVENTDKPLGRVRPLWGLVTWENARQLGGLATLHNDHLWLPGFVDPDSVSEEPDNHNLPGVDFYRTALSRTFAVNSGGSVGFFDYSGATSVALLRKWQQLSDLDRRRGKYVLGTRGLATTSAATGNADADPANNIPVVTYASRVRFHLVYGIPAFLTLAMAVLVLVVAAVAIFLRGSGIRRMTAFLSWTSVGRIFTSQTPRDGSALSVSLKPSERWITEEGRQQVAVIGDREDEIDEPKTDEGRDTPPAQQGLIQGTAAS